MIGRLVDLLGRRRVIPPLSALWLATLALAPGALALGLLLAVGGTTIAPALGGLYGRVGAAAPAGGATEAFGWLSSAFVAGGAIGSAASGAVVTADGPHVSFMLAAGLAALGCAAAWRADALGGSIEG